MSFLFVFSVVYILFAFLIYDKNNKKLSIVTSLIYSGGLLFCYNILMVSIVSFFDVGGSLVSYSVFNIVIGSIINLISFKKKKMQKYYFERSEFCCCLIIILLVFLVGFWKYRGFDDISYETTDPAVHYKYALSFEENLEILDKGNSFDFIYGDFSGVMPISYVNCGFMMKVLDKVPSYQVYLLFETVCLGLSSLLFFVTIFNFIKNKNYFYVLILSIMYFLGFPLNNMVFGFSYLGLGVMIINLLILTIFNITEYKEKIGINLIILFILNFSVFFSYYLFVPCIYLGVGIYYIYLWKKKEIDLKRLLLYGGVTLVIPFILGLVKFVLPGFGGDGTSVITAAGIDGYIYSNDSIGYFFIILTIVFMIKIIRNNKKMGKFDYWFGNITLFILLFYFCRMFGIISTYYFYKLFYLYWFFAIIFIGDLFVRRKLCIYVTMVVILIAMGLVSLIPNKLFTNFLVKSNIFCWNINTFRENRVVFSKKEIELVNESIKYNDICAEDKEFLITGHPFKNLWFYDMTSNIPLYGYEYNKAYLLTDYNITFDFWYGIDGYECLIYFYEGDNRDINNENVDVLFSNEEGAIIKRRR